MKKKLSLNKEKVSRLTDEQANSIQGGGTNKSTDHNFTCCLCTNLDSDGGNCTTVSIGTTPNPGATSYVKC